MAVKKGVHKFFGSGNLPSRNWGRTKVHSNTAPEKVDQLIHDFNMWGWLKLRMLSDKAKRLAHNHTMAVDQHI